MHQTPSLEAIPGPNLHGFLTTPETEKLDAALAKAQGEIRSAIKNAKNPHFKNDYADLASIWNACRGPLSKNGISVTQWPVLAPPGRIAMVTRIAHGGQWMLSVMEMPLAQSTAQGVGSAMTYLRRYMLGAVVGVAPDEDDDDGNGASRPPVEDDIPDAWEPPVQERSTAKPNFVPPRSESPPNPLGAAMGGAPTGLVPVTQPQLKRMFAIAEGKWTHEQIKLYLDRRWGIASSKDLTLDQYNELVGLIETVPYYSALIEDFKEG